MSNAVMIQPSSRMSRALAIAQTVACEEDLHVNSEAKHEQDKLQVKQLTYGLLNARRASDNYKMALTDIVNILNDVKSPLTQGEKVIIQTLISQRKAVMIDSLKSVISSGINFKEKVDNDIKEAMVGVDVSDYVN